MTKVEENVRFVKREVREEVLVLGVLEWEMQAYGWCTVKAESEEGRYGYL